MKFVSCAAYQKIRMYAINSSDPSPVSYQSVACVTSDPTPSSHPSVSLSLRVLGKRLSGFSGLEEPHRNLTELN